MEKPTGLNDMPLDALVIILSHLPLRQKLRLARLSRLFRAAANTDCRWAGRVLADPRTPEPLVQRLVEEAGEHLCMLNASSEVVADLSAERCARLSRLSTWKKDRGLFLSSELLALLERAPLAAVKVQNLSLANDAEQLRYLFANRARLQVAGALNLSALRVVSNETVELVYCLTSESLCTSAEINVVDGSGFLPYWKWGNGDDDHNREAKCLMSLLALRPLKCLKVTAFATEEGEMSALLCGIERLQWSFHEGWPYQGHLNEMELRIDLSEVKPASDSDWDRKELAWEGVHLPDLPITKLELVGVPWVKEDKASLSIFLDRVSNSPRLESFTLGAHASRYTRLPKDSGLSIGALLQASSSLGTLVVFNSLCKSKDLADIAEALERGSVLQKLTLFLPVGTNMDAMCKALRINKGLKELTLVRLWDEKWTLAELDLFCSALEVNTTLKSLSLQTCESSCFADGDKHSYSLSCMRIRALKRRNPDCAAVHCL